MADIDVDSHGPLFDGRASHAAKAYVDDVEKTIAQQTYDLVQLRLGAVLKNPTGYYQSRIQIDNVAYGTAINDGGVVYGPWLEGTSSRNNTTRFRGYFTFRVIGGHVERSVVSRAEALLPPYLRRME